MKAKFQKLILPGDRSFNLQASNHYHAYNEMHYHAEAELIQILDGQGTLLIGDQMETVKSGDLLLIGPNVPHLFRFETFYYQHPLHKQGKIDLPLRLLTLHFDPALFGKDFMALPENSYLTALMKIMAGSPRFDGHLRGQIAAALQQLLQAPPQLRLLQLMQLFMLIAEGKDYRFLHADKQTAMINATDETRLTKIYLYTFSNFQRTITLKEIAAVIYMSPNSFCRYFKSRTHKSYLDFLLEVRIRHARKLLRETDYSMVLVGYESGFTNLSNFNRFFKAFTGQTPLAFRKAYRQYAA